MGYLDLAGFKSRSVMPSADVDGLVRLRWSRNTPDALPSTITPETKVADVVVTGAVLFMLLTMGASVAHDAANYATITISKRTQGGAPVVIGSLDTHATDLPPGLPVAIPVSAGAITAEDVLTLSISKSGTGVAIPTFVLELRPSPSFFESAEVMIAAQIDSRLRKRYDVPFASPVPEAVLRWETALLTRYFMGRRGFNPGSEQDKAMILDAATTAEAEMKEAADSKDGLFELPLTQGANPDVTGVTKGAPLGYSETSPYVWTDIQACEGHFEDGLGRGQ